MRCRILSITFLSFLLTSLALTSHAQSPSATSSQQEKEAVRTNTRLVQTDVSVLDGNGQFVGGLKREQFELRVGGSPRPILFFERIKAGSSNEEAQIRAARGANLASAGSGTAIPLDRGRTAIFYLDDYHLAPDSIHRVRESLISFVQREMRQNDEIAVFSASGQLQFLQQLTSEKAVLLAALNKLGFRNFTVTDSGRTPMTEAEAMAITREDRRVLDYFVEQFLRESEPPRRGPATSPAALATTSRNRGQAEATVKLRARQVVDQTAGVSASTLSGLENLIRSYSHLAWRKVIFVISDGFPLNVGYQNLDIRRVIGAAAQSGVVICSIDAGGLSTGTADSSKKTAFDVTGRLAGVAAGALDDRQKVLHDLAVSTGGTVTLSSNALPETLNEILSQTADYYLIAWRPEESDLKQGKPQPLEVKVVDRSGLNVRVRNGFSVETSYNQPAVKSGGKKEKVDQLTRALHGLFPVTDLPLALSVGFTDKADKSLSLVATVEIPREVLEIKEGSDSELQLVGVAIDEQGKPAAGFEQNLTITSAADKVIYNHELNVPSGLYQVRVAARDKSGRVGSANQWITIPVLKGGPFVLGSVFVGDFNASDNLRISGAHRFLPNSRLGVLVYVYNAQTSPAPDVGLQLQILRDDQPVFTKPTVRIDTKDLTDLTRIPYAQDLDLRGLPAGNYVLRITAIDRISKKTASQSSRFTIY